MMSLSCRAEVRLATILVVFMLFFLWGGGARAGKPAKTKKGPVWVVLFSSADCPRCSHVDDRIRALQKKFPVKLKRFSIDRPGHYALFHAMEAIHGEVRFGVPLVIIGESIIIGEDEINRTLEETVKRLSQAGGSGLPYLGPSKRRKRPSVTPAAGSAADRPRPATSTTSTISTHLSP